MNWQDLLAVPFKLGGDDPATGLDCYGQARVIAQRAGLVLPDLHDGERVQDWLVRYPEACERVFASEGLRVGGLILSDPEGLGFASHVATVVVAGRKAWAITTSERSGPMASSAFRMNASHGIWRPPKEPAA